MNVLQEIAGWAKKLPAWQSDAIRRCLLQDSISADDEEELRAMLYNDFKLLPEKETAPTPQPLSDVLEEVQGDAKKVLLKELHSLSAVNALMPEQSLSFSLEGLTVIYGENGAGKSGYARVFKHACFAREKADRILPNVAVPTKSVPTATIELVVDNDDIAIEWQADAPTSELISEIAVFDSQCARVFLNEANEVVCVPAGMHIFRKLAAICDSLKRRVQADAALIPATLSCASQFKEQTAAGQFVRSVNAQTDLTRLDTLMRLDTKEVKRRDELRVLVASAASNQPKLKAGELRRAKSRLTQLLTSAERIESTLAESSLNTYKQLCGAATSAADADRLASADAFQKEPLPQIASNPWRQLFDAAKRFSEEEAYPDEDFPVTRDGAVCVLCQQELSVKARDRLNRFQKYVAADAAQQKRAADAALATAVDTVSNLATSPFEADAGALEEIRSRDAVMAKTVNEFFVVAHARKTSLVAACSSGKWETVTALPSSIKALLQSAIDALEQEAVKFDQADNPQELARLQQELAELEDRTQLTTYANEIRGFVLAKLKEAMMRECERSLDTTATTRFGNELMESAVTDQLVQTFDAELKAFQVACLPVSLKRSGEKGKTKHQLTLPTGVRPSDVLSEGEQRVIAFASFLSEVSLSNGTPPIVIDDPVSSLDHVYRERVARRLVEEAKLRQVVVFTHDIVLLLALERGCAEQAVPLLVHTVRRSASGPGECPNPPARPWHACSTNERLGYLKNESAKFAKMEKESPEEYAVAVADCYGKLRETWERTIEEVLLNDAIQRFRPGIETQRLKRVRIEPTDYQSISVAMTKCSAHMTGHDAAGAIGYQPATATEVQADIATCEAFVKALRQRQTKTADAADILVTSPQPVLSRTRASKVVKTIASVA